MFRVFLQVILPFLIPFLAFYAYRWLVTGAGPWVERGPWIWLCAAGGLLVIVTAIVVAQTTGAPQGSVYIPPHMEDGVVVPGRFGEPDAQEGGSILEHPAN